MPPARRTRRPLLALVALLLLLIVGYAVQAAQSHKHGSPPTTTRSAVVAPSSGGAIVALSALPAGARSTVALIRAGGPFPHARDGVVFVNYEGLLPHRYRGYYHEYTVTTPGESDRGPRRIIVGGSEDFYYTADHDATFRRVDLHR